MVEQCQSLLSLIQIHLTKAKTITYDFTATTSHVVGTCSVFSLSATPTSWILDLGATTHICSCQNMFHHLISVPRMYHFT